MGLLIQTILCYGTRSYLDQKTHLGMEELSSWHWSSLKSIQTKHQWLNLSPKCSIPIVIYSDGSICLDILQNQWSPIYDVSAVLTSIQSLLSDPNPNSPANSEAARLYSENRRDYNKKVQEVVEASWMEKVRPQSSGSVLLKLYTVVCRTRKQFLW